MAKQETVRERIATAKANIELQPPDYKETYLWQNDLRFADQILNIFIEQLDKLTVIKRNPYKKDGTGFDEYTDGVLYDIYKDTAKKQLQHTISQLKEILTNKEE